MKFVTVTIGGITQQVPEADVSLYLRAGYSVVNESAPVEPVVSAADESEIFAKINEAKNIKDLYAIQDLYPVRSPLVENALNTKGQELMAAELKQADKSKE